MKKIIIIWQIGVTELKSFFYSPVAWVVLILFTIHAGVIFNDILEPIIRFRKPGPSAVNLKEYLLSIHTEMHQGFFVVIEGYLFLYIPLLTMGLFSRELGSGSIKLLQSSPVSSIQVVLGKYVSMMVMGLLLILILAGYVAIGAYSITNVDLGLAVSGLIGVFLLICTFAAIGLFMSCLSSHQVIAAIGTLAVLGLLNYIKQIAYVFHLPDAISYYMQLSGRTDQIIAGLLSTKNIFYFVVLTQFFLGIAVLKLMRMARLKPLVTRIATTTVFATICMMEIYLASQQKLIGYLDITTDKKQTLTKSTQTIIRQLNRPIEMHTYIDLISDNTYVGLAMTESEDKDYFEKYRRFIPGLKMDYTYYYDTLTTTHWHTVFPGKSNQQIAQVRAKSLNIDFGKVLSFEQVNREVRISGEGYPFVKEVKMGNKTSYLRAFEVSSSYKEKTNQPSENEVANSLKRLLVPPPKIIFLTGNGERGITEKGDKGYCHATIEKYCRGALINRGFDVDTIDLRNSEIPDDLAVLVIADPDTAFSPIEKAKLYKYIDKGGNLLVAAEPGKQAILNPLLSHLGIQLNEGELVHAPGPDAPNFLLANFSKASDVIFPLFGQFLKDSDKVVLRGSAALSYQTSESFKATPILTVSKRIAWQKLQVSKSDTRTKPDTALGPKDQYWATALALTRKIGNREQRIMVTGDADFLTETEMDRDNVGSTWTRDLDFAKEIFKWFSYGSFPVDADHPDSYSRYRVGLAGIAGIRVLDIIAVPALLFLTGTILLIYRNRR